MKQDANERILLAHGGGGRLTEQLIRNRILPRVGNETLAKLADAACVQLSGGNAFFTTDSYVVKPLFFNGGDIGKLAVCGTVNDLAVAGARPVALSLSLIIEEGLELSVLDRILTSIAQAAKESGVRIVAGDTKVVESGAADKIFINTAGVGEKLDGVQLGFDRIETGDKVIVNGTLGDHGMTIISQREDIGFQSELVSDCAPLAELTARVFELGADVKFMRDPTRGGLAAILNEIAVGSGRSIEISHTDIPVNRTVQAAADALGFDVLDIANEGKFAAVVHQRSAEEAVKVCRSHPLGKAASIIGTVLEAGDEPVVELVSEIGGRRIVQMPYGRELPRIC